MDEAKALLDSLMGPSRNTDSKNKTGEDFKGSNVCKNYLVGFCPADWFSTRTQFKRKFKPCEKAHSEAMKAEFEAHPKVEKYRREYENNFYKYLDEIVKDADQWVLREKRTVKPKGVHLVIPEDVQPQFKELEKEYEKLLKEAEVSHSEEAMRKATTVKEQIDQMKEKHTVAYEGEEVCEVCGMKYLLGDNRTEKHYQGKMHEGYTRIRQTLEDLRQKRQKASIQDEERHASRSRSRDKSSERDKKAKARSRSRSRGKNKSDDRGKKPKPKAKSRSRSEEKKRKTKRKQSDSSSDDGKNKKKGTDSKKKDTGRVKKDTDRGKNSKKKKADSSSEETVKKKSSNKKKRKETESTSEVSSRDSSSSGVKKKRKKSASPSRKKSRSASKPKKSGKGKKQSKKDSKRKKSSSDSSSTSSSNRKKDKSHKKDKIRKKDP